MNAIICGRRREGKTTLGYALAKKLHGFGVACFDPRGIIKGVRVSDADELEYALSSKIYLNGPICYTSDVVTVESAFEEMCNVLFPPRFSRTNFALLVDEAGQLQSPNTSHPSLYRAVAMHPIKEIAIIQTAHRLADFHGQSKALMDELYVFQTTHPGDLRTLLDYTGDRYCLSQVKALPPHHCLHYSYFRNSSGKQSRIINSPESWYHPITADQQSIQHEEVGSDKS